MHHWLSGMDASGANKGIKERTSEKVTLYHNRILKVSKALLKSQVHQGTSLFTSAATNQRGFSKGGQKKPRSDFQRARRGQSSC